MVADHNEDLLEMTVKLEDLEDKLRRKDEEMAKKELED